LHKVYKHKVDNFIT